MSSFLAPLFRGSRSLLVLAVSTVLLPAQKAPPPAPPPGYQVPPRAILDILDAPPPPSAALSGNNHWVVTTERDLNFVTLAELAEPMLTLAGMRMKQYPDSRLEPIGITRLTLKRLDGSIERTLVPPAGGRILSTASVRDSATDGELAYALLHQDAMSLHLYDATTGVDRVVATPGLQGKIAGLSFTRDGRLLAFTATTRAGVALWIAETRTATARRVEGVLINHINGGISWTRGRPPLIARTIVAGRGEPPKPDEIPTGPVIQEATGRAAQSRTFQNLLKDAHDEALFDYYFTNQIVSINAQGAVTPLGPPGIHSVQASPDGEYLLVNTTLRPYSYQLPMGAFATRTAVWKRTGELVRVVHESPLRENLPSARDAVIPGIRGISWRSDAPATLVLLEALDDGDPQKPVAKRDRLSLLPAPFAGERVTFAETELRYGGIIWAYPELALLTERSSRTARTRTWVLNPAQPATPPRLLWDRNSEDRYSDPGRPVYTYDAAEYRMVPLRSADRRWLYLEGNGAAKDGARPFLDRLDLTTLKPERLWQSAPPHYENLSEVLDSEARRIVFTRESPTQRPNLFLRELDRPEARQLTDLPEPSPWFATVKGELVRYRRSDGVELSAKLYLPPGYNQSRDGPLPFLLWAYPDEFLTAEGANQLSGSPLQFRRPSRQDHLLFLALGYGVLDDPTMPIMAKNGREPNDGYVEQLVASAQAAVDYLAERGVGDRQRMAVGGHSYGAFMTANLLAHSDLFRAGIARSGAYNRTLTPFGFQAEPRTYWQAPEIYHQMSPFTHVPKINEPLLMIHGMRDSNPGTFPIQSERMFAAIKAAGGNARYVQLPLEDHGYTARESRRHVLWEMITWLDRHVKHAPPVASAGGKP